MASLPRLFSGSTGSVSTRPSNSRLRRTGQSFTCFGRQDNETSAPRRHCNAGRINGGVLCRVRWPYFSLDLDPDTAPAPLAPSARRRLAWYVRQAPFEAVPPSTLFHRPQTL